MNSTLGSVVPLAMFSEQRGVWGEKPSYKTFPPQKRSPTATTALLVWSWDGTSTILTSVQLLHQIVGHLPKSKDLDKPPPDSAQLLYHAITSGQVIPNLILHNIDYKSLCLQNGTESLSEKTALEVMEPHISKKWGSQQDRTLGHTVFISHLLASKHNQRRNWTTLPCSYRPRKCVRTCTQVV